MHQRHRGADGDRLTDPAPRADEVGRHQRLPVSGRDRVERAEPDREQQRERDDRDAEGRAVDQRREGASDHPGPGAGGIDRPRRHDVARPRSERERRAGDVQRALEEVRGIGVELVAHRAHGDGGAPDRLAVRSEGGDLPPADVVRVVVVRVRHAPRGRRRAGELGVEPQDVQPSLSGMEPHRRRAEGEFHRRPADRQMDLRHQVRGGGTRPRLLLLLARHAVAVRVDPLLRLLIGRDLRHVDGVVDPDLVRDHGDAAVEVDREVAERMRRRRCRDRVNGRDRGDDHRASPSGAAHAPPSLARVLAASWA